MKSVTRPRSRIAELSFLAPLLTTTIVIAALYFGREVLIPFALALLLSFLLAPPVTLLERAKIGRAVSVVFVLVIAFSALGGMLWLGATQLAEIVNMVPSYQHNIQKKIEAMRNPAGSALGKAADSITTLTTQLSAPAQPSEPKEELARTKARKKATPRRNPDAPVPVELVKHQPGVVDSIGLVGVSIAHFLELTAGVLIFTLFMLMQRSDLRNRLFRLFGEGHLNVMTTALDDAANRVSKYLFTQSLVNGAFGLLLGSGLYWIGVPNAPFWGVMGAVLRFVPYVGSLISGLCPLILALAVFEGWTRPLLTFGLFAGIEIVLSSAVEPWLYGAHTGLSSLAILVSAAFWTLLWGPIGLVLSTPLTVCLLVMGRYVPALSPLSILLGDQPVLPPEAVYYQRLLAGDDDEAQAVAEAFLKEHDVLELYDVVLIPALSLAEQDRHDDTLDDDRVDFVYQNTRSLIEDLENQAPDHDPPPELVAPDSPRLSIVCVPGRDKADELVAFMLRHVLHEAGQNVRVIPSGSSEEMLNAIGRQSPEILFISALPPLSLSHARSMCRRLRRSFGDAKIIVGVWNSPADKLKAAERWTEGTCDALILSLKEAEAQVRLFLDPQSLQNHLAPTETESVPT